MSKKWLLVIFVPLAIILLIAGAWYGLKLNKEKEVKDSFAKTLDMYQLKIWKIYTTKKDTEMKILIK